MNIILFDGPSRNHLLPFTFTRPVSEIRVGIITLREKWEKRIEGNYSWQTEEYLQGKYPMNASADNLFINGALCANDTLAKAVGDLKLGQKLEAGDILLAAKLEGQDLESNLETVSFDGEFNLIDRPWKIFFLNGAELEADFDLITKGRKSQPLSETNTVIGDRIFVEEGVEAECAVFNTKSGAIYLGKDSSVMEGSVVRGGLALGEHSQLKLSAKIYGPTTIGPHSKVGGEVNNSVIFGYSNKGHDGFLGNSVIGEWCNIGADTNNSNLKNNYDEVRIWSYVRGGFERTGLQFCGLMMGDHSKCGINTMFNTGTVVGVSANIYGGGFPRNFIPSFSWGGSGGFVDYKLDKALATAGRVMERRKIDLDENERSILQHVYDTTKASR
ncbi:GlmU family protein [Owenweeksia hongkongensis]|uniref:GlmU family protein n=1 Tax=Owenweeksia hongkongensis TaxID=253245 RepID=UPI003A8E96CB